MGSISRRSSLSLSYDSGELLTNFILNKDFEIARAVEADKKRRKKLKSLNLSNMPVKCFERIASYLDIKDVLSLGQTCKRTHYILHNLYEDEIIRRINAIKEIKESACAAYGALAKCERETNNAEKLLRITSATLGLRSIIPPGVMLRGEEYLLQFDSDGIPSLLRYSQLVQSDPNMQKLGGRASFYRGDHLWKVHKEIAVRRRQFGAVYREFSTKDLDPKQPMQDLRNRATRVKTMQSVYEVLQRAWECSVSFHERFSREIPAVQKKLRNAKKLVGYDSKIPSWDYQEDSQIRIQHFCIRQQVLLGANTIQVNDGFGVYVGIPVRVYGKLETRIPIAELKGSTFISVFFGRKEVATCEFTKVWHSSRGHLISEADTIETEKVTEENRAYIEMKVNEIEPNEVVIDLPSSTSRRTKLCCKPLIENIYMQFAAEVLLREDFPALYTRVVGARVFGYQSVSRASLTLRKKDSAPETSSSTDKFSRLRDKDGNAALVPFVLEPTTWEEYFASHGYLLGNSTEPVLPKFINTDFEKPAAAATPTCSSR